MTMADDKGLAIDANQMYDLVQAPCPSTSLPVSCVSQPLADLADLADACFDATVADRHSHLASSGHPRGEPCGSDTLSGANLRLRRGATCWKVSTFVSKTPSISGSGFCWCQCCLVL